MKREIWCERRTCIFNNQESGCILPLNKIKITNMGWCKSYVPNKSEEREAFIHKGGGNDESTAKEDS